MNQDLIKHLFEYKDGELYWKTPTNQKIVKGSKAGGLHRSGYMTVQIDKKKYRTHRLVFLYHYGYLPKEIDHIDNNKINNNINNLRQASRSENMKNIGFHSKNKSGFKGVSWHKASNRWIVQLMVGNNKNYFGIYKDIELAELVAMEVRNKYHKEFARHK
jgi:hypothetical protein